MENVTETINVTECALDEMVDETLTLAGEVIPEVEEFDAMSAGEKMAKETIVFEIHFHRPGFRKPIPPTEFISKIKEAGEKALTAEQEEILNQYRSQVVTSVGPNGEQTDTTMLHVSQDILRRKEISKIVTCDGMFNNYIKGLSIPSPMLAPGMHQVSLKRAAEIDAAVELFLVRRQKLINAFRDKYAELKEDAKQHRFPFYNEADYPAWATIEAEYSIDYQFIGFSTPAALQTISTALYEREKQKVKAKWAEAAEEAREAQRIAFQGLLDHFVEMLSKDEATGKRKTFKPTAVKKLQSFLTMFDEINITGDAELEQIIKQTKEIVAGVDVTALKKDATLRDTMHDSINKMKDSASKLVIVRERKVAFEDEDESEVMPL